MESRKRIKASVCALAIAIACGAIQNIVFATQGGEAEGSPSAVIDAINAGLAAAGKNVRVDQAELFVHAAKWDGSSTTIIANDRQHQLSSQFVERDPRRGGFADISYLVDQSDGAAVLAVLALVRFIGCDVILGLERDPPQPPGELKVLYGNERITLTWGKSPNAAKYQIKQRDIPSGPYTNGPLIDAPTFDGWMGMVIEVRATPLRVVALGRVANNNGTHAVKIVDVNGVDVPGGQVSVEPTSVVTAGNFRYQNLEPGIALNANTTYFVMTHDVQNTDPWYEFDTLVFTHPEAAVRDGVYQEDTSPGIHVRMGGADHSYGPVDILYQPKM